MSRWVAGVDGCRAGWVVVQWDLDGKMPARFEIVRTFREILELPEAPRVIAIDIPIGLPERAIIGGRQADVAARSLLGARQSAVFAVPDRAAVMQTEYRAACDVAFAHSDPPRRISKQAFHLFPKIREVDALMTPALQSRVVECHPEAAFVQMNDGKPLALAKKIKSRPNDEGLRMRSDLLARAGFPTFILEARHAFSRSAGRDDLIDACACAWSAARILKGTAIRFPADPPVDARGLRQEIWA